MGNSFVPNSISKLRHKSKTYLSEISALEYIASNILRIPVSEKFILDKNLTLIEMREGNKRMVKMAIEAICGQKVEKITSNVLKPYVKNFKGQKGKSQKYVRFYIRTEKPLDLFSFFPAPVSDNEKPSNDASVESLIDELKNIKTETDTKKEKMMRSQNLENDEMDDSHKKMREEEIVSTDTESQHIKEDVKHDKGNDEESSTKKVKTKSADNLQNKKTDDSHKEEGKSIKNTKRDKERK